MRSVDGREMTDLLTCPFCGGSRLMAQMRPWNYEGEMCAQIVCVSCHAGGPTLLGQGDVDVGSPTPAMVEAWNRRADNGRAST